MLRHARWPGASSHAVSRSSISEHSAAASTIWQLQRGFSSCSSATATGVAAAARASAAAVAAPLCSRRTTRCRHSLAHPLLLRTQRALLHLRACTHSVAGGGGPSSHSASAHSDAAATAATPTATAPSVAAASADASEQAALDAAAAYQATFDKPLPAAPTADVTSARVAAAAAIAARRRRSQPPPPVVATWGAGFLGALGRQSYEPAPTPIPVKLSRFNAGDPAAADPSDPFPDPVPATVAANWGRNVLLSTRGSVYHWGWRAPFRTLLQVAGWHRASAWLVSFMQRMRWGSATPFCGAAPLGPQRMPGWGHEHGDAPIGEGEEERLYAVAAATGSDYSAVLSSGGQVYTWGHNFYGQLGHSHHLTDTRALYPRLVCHYQNQHPNESLARHIESGTTELPRSFPETPLVQVATGFAHTLFLTRAGQVYACGKSDGGALGITHIYRDSNGVFLPHLVPVTDAFWAGESGSGEQGLRESAWDSGEACRTVRALANNSEEIVDSYIGPVAQVAAGMKFSLFLNRRGQVFACGGNGLGELGDGTFHSKAGLVKVVIPLRHKPLDRSVRWMRNRGISRAFSSNVDVVEEGGLLEQELEEEESNYESFFSASTLGTPLASERITSVAAGLHHAVALSSLGHVYTWGLNQSGQCGFAPPANRRWNHKNWEKNALSWKKRAPTLKQVQAVEDALRGPAPAGALEPYRHASLRNLAPVNSAREKQVGEICRKPARFPLEEHAARWGISMRELGQVVEVAAGFYDTVLLTDRGYCITFGGGLAPSAVHQPHLLSLGQTTDAPVAPEVSKAAHPWPRSTRVKQVAFGLGHAVAIVQPPAPAPMDTTSTSTPTASASAATATPTNHGPC